MAEFLRAILLSFCPESVRRRHRSLYAPRLIRIAVVTGVLQTLISIYILCVLGIKGPKVKEGWYELERKYLGPPPRPYVYVLREAPAGKILRRYEEYDTSEIVFRLT